MSGCRSPPREWTESLLNTEHKTSMIPYLGGHRQALCGVGRMSTLFLFHKPEKQMVLPDRSGEKRYCDTLEKRMRLFAPQKTLR